VQSVAFGSAAKEAPSLQTAFFDGGREGQSSAGIIGSKRTTTSAGMMMYSKGES
jgi:hypothetical protein